MWGIGVLIIVDCLENINGGHIPQRRYGCSTIVQAQALIAAALLIGVIFGLGRVLLVVICQVWCGVFGDTDFVEL